MIGMVILTYYEAESITKRGLGPSQAIVWQVDILRRAIDVASTHPSSCIRTENGKLLKYLKKKIQLLSVLDPLTHPSL